MGSGIRVRTPDTEGCQADLEWSVLVRVGSDADSNRVPGALHL